MDDYIRIRTPEDVTETVLDHAQDVEESWFASERAIDWEVFLTRLETYGYDLGPTTDSPAIRKIRRHIRELRRQG